MTTPEVRSARAAWSRIAEPGDSTAGALLRAVGPVDALRWLESLVTPGADAGPGAWVPSPATVRRGVAGLCDVLGVDDPGVRRRLASAVARWLPRAGRVDPAHDLANLERLGGRVVVPGDAEWPAQMDDLGDEAPVCLWVRGTARVDEVLERSVAVVGARASTGYGERLAAEIAAGLAESGRATVSGGAYGIDAAVHRASVAVDGVTVAFLAGGVDRLYPAGNTELLRAVGERGGLLLSEVPPGAVPSRVRFLRRNRLIAAAGRATVVVEAAWRSGSLVTARLAAGLGRPVGAVPGPVTSVASAGCHRLMREGVAVCVTDAAEVLELVGAAGEGVADLARIESARDLRSAREQDGLDVGARATFDALRPRRPGTVEELARSSGLAPHEVMAALGVLELRGSASRSGGGWVRVTTDER